MNEVNNKILNLPLLALRGLCVFTGVTIHFDVGRTRSVKALEDAMKEGQRIFLVAQKDMKTNSPTQDDLYRVGTVARIKQVLKLPGDSIRVLVEGENRAVINEFIARTPYYIANITLIDETVSEGSENFSEALLRAAQKVFDEYILQGPKISSEVVLTVKDAKDPGFMADYIAAHLPLRLEDKQAILEEFDPLNRLGRITAILEREIQVLDIEREIQIQTKEQIDKNQKEYYLREQLKAIYNELGEGESVISESDEFKKKIHSLKLAPETEEKFLKEADRLTKTSFSSSEGVVIRTYLETCLELPWQKQTKDKINLDYARKILDRDHYGLDKVKERILEFLAVKKLNPDLKGQVLCFAGPPGVGKTSVAKSIATAMGRKYVRVSLGGVRDEADIRGHRKTYIGSMPGRIINAMQQAGTKNPVILLDEVDKLSSDYRGDPSAALLEVLDIEQNKAFIDHYIEVPFDLSNVLFITTANTLSEIPRPLLDRMDIIELSSYTQQEKVNIARDYLLPKQIKNHGLRKSSLKVSDDMLNLIISGYTREAGVRTLERTLGTICRKSAMAIVDKKKKTVKLDAKLVKEFLGPQKYFYDSINDHDEIGVVCGLAWTSVGGDTLFVEVNVVEGTGKIELTGKLGDVMKESAYAAFSYIRSRAQAFHIEHDFYKKYDTHIHFPEGAVPKDGPSAGITIATALISAFTKTPVKRDIAMTGEITIRGRVLPIGGLKEKTMAAYRAGIGTVIIPKENESDLAEIDPVVLENIKFVLASNMDQVVSAALLFGQKDQVLESLGQPIPVFEQPYQQIKSPVM